MNLKRLFYGLVLSTLCFYALGQEVPFFTNKQLQYNYFNPGYIPELQYATIGISGKFQWVGLEGQPIDGFFSGKYFFLGAHSQIGFNMLYDKIGYQQVINPKLNYAFCIPIGDDCYLNMGMSAGLVNKNYDYNEIDYGNTLTNEQAKELLSKLERGNAADIDAGFEILIQNFEFGGAVNHLLKGNERITMNKTIFAFANYNFQSSEWWRLSPFYTFLGILANDEKNHIWKHQMGLQFHYITDYDNVPMDLFYIGAAYRHPREGSVMAGFSFGFFSVFYSYDYFFGDLRNNSHGSHEVGIEFKIKQQDRGCYANYGKTRKKFTRYFRM